MKSQIARWLTASLTVLAAAVFALCASAGVPAQSPASSRSDALTGSDAALLAKASALYYSTARAGLAGFECQVRPDWRTAFKTADPNAILLPDDGRLALLDTVKIALHAQMSGASTLDWDPPRGRVLDTDSAELMDRMHRATEQTLMGFLQFWTPFVDGAIVPVAAKGLTVTHAAGSFSLHAEDGGADVTEVFSDNLQLTEFDVVSHDQSIRFEPSYQSTPEGLLVERFIAHIQAAGPLPGPAHEMRVGIEYQTVEGFPIPSQLNLEAAGAATLKMALSGCTVTRTGSPAPQHSTTATTAFSGVH